MSLSSDISQNVKFRHQGASGPGCPHVQKQRTCLRPQRDVIWDRHAHLHHQRMRCAQGHSGNAWKCLEYEKVHDCALAIATKLYWLESLIHHRKRWACSRHTVAPPGACTSCFDDAAECARTSAFVFAFCSPGSQVWQKLQVLPAVHPSGR